MIFYHYGFLTLILETIIMIILMIILFIEGLGNFGLNFYGLKVIDKKSNFPIYV